MSRYIGSIDQGTTSTRFIVFDEFGQAVASHQIKFDTIEFPEPEKSGWAEHDPMVIYDTVVECIKAVHSKLNSPLAAVGITNQRETTVIWDKTTGRPLYNALVWHDTRTKNLVEEHIQKFNGDQNFFRKISGLPLSPYFSAFKIIWLINNVPQIQQAIINQTAMFGTIDSWIIWKLTGGVNDGVHVTDVTNASRTLLMNLSTTSWDKSTLNYLNISDKLILPSIKSNSEVYGYIKEGPLNGVAISGCIGDQQSALLGQLCIDKGSAKTTYGTGSFLLMNTGNTPVYSQHGLLTTVAYKLGPNVDVHYALEGAVGTAGSAVEWLKEMKLIPDVRQLDLVAGEVSDSGGIYFVPAFSGLLSPYYRDDARGLIIGLSHSTRPGHITRALIEAVAFQTKEVLDCMGSDAGFPLKSLKVDGGLSQSKELLNFESNLLGINVERPMNVEATALGAAIAAGLAQKIHFWDNQQEMIQSIMSKKEIQIIKPNPSDKLSDPNKRNFIFKNWKRAVNRSLGWLENDQSKSSHSSTSSKIPSFCVHRRFYIAAGLVGAACFAAGLVVSNLIGRSNTSKSPK